MRLAYLFNRDATEVAYNGLDFEGEPTLDGAYADWELTHSWVRPFWDLYDENDEGTHCSNKRDYVSWDLASILDAYRRQRDHFGSSTDNGSSKEDGNSKDPSTNNLWDFVNNFEGAHGAASPYWDAAYTVLHHNCMDNLPTN